MKSRNKYLTLIISVSLLAGACKPEEKKIEEEKVFLPLVKLESAENKTFIHKIIVQGNVETEKDVLLNAEMGGLITNIHVKSGQKVNAGQILVTLDGSMLSSSSDELKTQLEYAEYILKKQEELKNRGVGSDFDYKTALNQVNSIKSKINSLNVQRGKMVVKAPFSGMIDVIYAKQGQMAGPQAPLLRLVNNETIDITASISEKHLSKVKIGTAMDVTFPNFNDTVLRLKVTNIGNYIEPTNRTFRVISTLKNNKIFLPNMLAEISITDFEAANATVIPSGSIMKSQDDRAFVFVAVAHGKDQYKVEKVWVDVIEKHNGETMIANNPKIKEGSLIVVEGARGITEKDIVRSK